MKKYSEIFNDYYIKCTDDYIRKRKIYWWKRRIFMIQDNCFTYIEYKQFLKFVSRDKILNDYSTTMSFLILTRLKEVSKNYPENLKNKLEILYKKIRKYQFMQQYCNIKRFDLDL